MWDPYKNGPPIFELGKRLVSWRLKPLFAILPLSYPNLSYVSACQSIQAYSNYIIPETMIQWYNINLTSRHITPHHATWHPRWTAAGHFLSKRLKDGTTAGRSCRICAKAKSCLGTARVTAARAGVKPAIHIVDQPLLRYIIPKLWGTKGLVARAKHGLETSWDFVHTENMTSTFHTHITITNHH